MDTEWYYADGNQQKGPISQNELQQLASEGKIADETLVWQKGMAEWTPYDKIAPQLSSGGVNLPCYECGKSFTTRDLIEIDGQRICSSCKPIALQRMREGAAPRRAPAGTKMAGNISQPTIDPIAEAERIKREGYPVSFSSCLKRSIGLFKEHFWPLLGNTLLIYIIVVIASSFCPFAGVLAGPLFGGLSLYYLKKIRGQHSDINDAFSGFSIQMGATLLIALVMGIIYIVPFVPGYAIVVGQSIQNPGHQPIAGMILMYAGLFIGMATVGLTWTFAVPLAVDKRLEFWPAMELSRKVMWKNLFPIFGFFFLQFLLFILIFVPAMALLALAFVAFSNNSAGNEGLGLGFLFLGLGFLYYVIAGILVLPVSFGTIYYLYEDAFTPKSERLESNV